MNLVSGLSVCACTAAILAPSLITSTALELYSLAALCCFWLLSFFATRARESSRIASLPSISLVVGFATPLIPWLGSSLILPLSLLYSLSIGGRRNVLGALLWASPLLAYLLGSSITELFYAVPFVGAITIDSPQRFHDVAMALVTTQVPSWSYLARMSVFALFVSVLGRNEGARHEYLKGALSGVLVAGLLAVASFCGAFSLSTQTPFWSSLNRISGTMTDPNALGIVMGLGLWLAALCLPLQRMSPLAAIALLSPLVAGGVVAGSRTFMIALVLFVLAMTWTYFRAATSWLLGIGLASIIGVSLLDSSTNLIQEVSTNPIVPEGARRTIVSLSIPRIREALFSRSVFLSISSSLIESAPIHGVGADRYRSYVGLIAEDLKLPIGSWTDNSNNLYLGIVAELGLLGGIAFLMSIFGRRLRSSSEVSLGPLAIAALSLLFLTGPHTDFAEVFIIVGAIVAHTTRITPRPLSSQFLTIPLFLALGCVAPHFRERGVFDWHRDIDSVSRWLSPHASIALPCVFSADERSASITLKSSYVPTREPLRVHVYANGSQHAIIFSKPEEQTVALKCSYEQHSIVATVDTRPPWSPYRAWPGNTEDRRFLGVQQIVRSTPKP